MSRAIDQVVQSFRAPTASLTGEQKQFLNHVDQVFEATALKLNENRPAENEMNVGRFIAGLHKLLEAKETFKQSVTFSNRSN